MKIIKWLIPLLICAALLLGCSKVTRENFDQIKMGMTYEEVIGIIGAPDSCDASLGAKQCVWGDEAKNITVGFMGDTVILPSMKGL